MARKELFYTEEGKGRDNGKVFFIKEMSATAAEWWAIRAGLAMAKNGVQIPEDIAKMGMVGLSQIGFDLLGGISPVDAKPLLDELMACVQFVPNPADHSIKRGLIEDDIEEISTRLKLRAEAFKLHVDFFKAAAN